MSTDRVDGPADATDGPLPEEPAGGSERNRPGRGGWHRQRAGAEKKSSLLRELPVLLVVAFVLALAVKTFLVQAFFIPSGSMEQTLHGCTGCTGDRVLVNKVPYWFGEPEPGDIVVFKGPDTWSPEISVEEPGNWVSGALLTVGRAVGVAPPSEDDFVKRVVATAGQTVECCDTQGRVMVDGKPLDEPYIFEDKPAEQRGFGAVTVPEGRLWVMGDHRAASADSREHVSDQYSGTVGVEDVIGKAALIVWPVDRFALLDDPDIQGQDQALGAPVVQGSAAVAAPYALGLVGAVPLTAWRRRRHSASRRAVSTGPSSRPPGTGWRRIRRGPRTRPGRDPAEG
jgi:signal peptidase I